MIRFVPKLLLMAILLSNCIHQTSSEFSIKELTPFGVSYVKLSPDQVKEYEMVIVEPDFYNGREMKELRSSGTKIIAYVPLGEVDANRWYYSDLEEIGFLGVNKNWNSAYIDLEDDVARNFILDQVIPKIMAKEPDGLFLDTIDAVAPVTERADLKPYMVELIKGIREKYPHKIIIQNSGLFLIKETQDVVDAFLTEALASDYDFTVREYRIREDEEIEDRLEYLNHFSELSGKPFFIIGFAEEQDKIDQLKVKLDPLNRPYFISNIGLSELPTDPTRVANDLKKD